MVRNRFAEYVDYAIVGASGVSAFCAAGGALYAIPWSGCTPRVGASREYNILWGVRLSMQLTAVAWLLSPVIQLHETWSPHIPILDGLNWSPSVLCRLYSALRFGWFEPFFLLTSLLTFKHTLSRKNWETFGSGGHCNMRIIGTAILSSIPILGAQTLSALATLYSGDQDESPLQELFLSIHTSHPRECDGSLREDHKDGCTLCTFSFLSTLLCFLFITYYLWRMWQVTLEMAQITLNHSLEQRIRLFRNAVTTLLLLSLVFRGFSILSEPKEVAFKLLRLGDFISMVLVVAAASIMLVIRPVRDARLADKSVSAAVLDSAQDFLGASNMVIS